MVDDACVAFAAARGHFHAGVQQVGDVAAAYNGGYAHFARHDSGMAGAPSFVGDDGTGLFHDRLPIRVRHVGHEDIARFEILAITVTPAAVQAE